MHNYHLEIHSQKRSQDVRMGIVRQIALVVLLLSFIVFVALFGRIPAFRSTPIGAFHRLLLHRLPSAAKHVDERLTGGRLTASSARYEQYLFHGSNPVVLISYLLLLTTAAALFLHKAWSHIPTLHHYIIPPLVTLPYIFTYLTSTLTASYISTPSLAHAELSRYPFDYVLYHPHNACSTCHFEKPARSKHCSLCKTCVIRCDHHCVWVNNCIGLHNYKYFLALLLSLGVLLVYGASLAWNILAVSRAWDRNGASRFQKLTLAIAMNVQVGGVGLLAGLTAPLAWGLLLYHVYLIWAGLTTNETAKWSGLKGDIADGYAWKGRRLVPKNMDTGFEELDSEIELSGSEQIVVVMRDERHPSSLRLYNVYSKSWRELWSLHDVVNIYDEGFWTNLKDALDWAR